MTEYQETAPGWPALEKIPADIVAAQTVEVDDVSGATMSSKGVKAAVRAALVEAGMRDDAILDDCPSTASTTRRFYSYRAEGGTCGRHGAIAVLHEGGLEEVNVRD